MSFIKVDSRNLSFHATPDPLDRRRPTLVCIHGAGGSSSLWNLLAGRLRPLGIPLLRLDLPGHGRSDLPGEESVDGYASALSRFIELLGLEQVVLCGHSMGGAISIQTALQRPVWLKALILLCTGGRLRVLPSFLQSLEKGEREALHFIQQVGFGAGVDPEIVRVSYQELASCNPEVLYRDFLACDRYDNLARLGSIDLPTLVGCGDADLMTPLKYSRYLASAIPGAYLEVFPGAGHMLPLERPAELAEAIGKLWREKGFASPA
ncbi:MAG: alpha/beta hydrolase [Bradymonadales bacterium]|nr:alpha/beta hydrolase [Bradymonadales bacterium]